MGYFPVRYDSRVVNYDRRGFIRLATDANFPTLESRQWFVDKDWIVHRPAQWGVGSRKCTVVGSRKKEVIAVLIISAKVNW